MEQRDYRVMLVDDEENALDFLEILFREIGGVEIVGRYSNAMHALEALRTTGVDAVFMDIEMPGLSGTDAVEQYRRQMPDLQVVFTTAFPEYAVKAFDLRITDYLLKPFTRERLQDALQRISLAPSPSTGAMPDPDKPAIRIRCFDGFRIESKGERLHLAWRTYKEKELFAFLVHHGGNPVETSMIIESLWPEYNLEKAKAYLYTCVSLLRRTLRNHTLPFTLTYADRGYAIEMRDASVDVADFELALKRLGTAKSLESEYRRMNALYTGPYLSGCDYAWSVVKRDELASLYVQALRMAHERFARAGEYALAADSLKRVLAVIPDSESDGRSLIRLYLSTGQRNEAMKMYHRLVEYIRTQLGVEPEAATLSLRERFAEREA